MQAERKLVSDVMFGLCSDLLFLYFLLQNLLRNAPGCATELCIILVHSLAHPFSHHLSVTFCAGPRDSLPEAERGLYTQLLDGTG